MIARCTNGIAHRFAIACLLAGTAACHRDHWPGLDQQTADTPMLAPHVPMPPPPIPSPTSGSLPEGELPPPGSHPRILLSPERLAIAEANFHGQTQAWKDLEVVCEDNASKDIESGYEGEDWANGALDLALCGRVMKKSKFTQQAIKYLMSLVDDKEKVGDKGGGDNVVHANDGYPIRNRGFLAAIAYDWLHEDLTAAQRLHLIGRFHAFFVWYRKDGYNHEHPVTNHYMGYFNTGVAAGIACEGDDPRCTEIRKATRDLWNREVVPAYRSVAGGDFPEGFQYVRLVGAGLGLYVDATRRINADLANKMLTDLPWLRESIAFQAHALMPDTIHNFDNADWSHKPATPFPMQLYGVAAAYPSSDPIAKRALWLARKAKRPDEPTWNWLQVPLDDPNNPGEDPRKGVTSYLAKGTGTVFARTDWGPNASWFSLNSGPFFGDHQHEDQGHFEITRGTDLLLIDPGDYDSYSSTSHNTLLVDDHKESDRWSPNQLIYCTDCSITRFEDSGKAVYAASDFTGAYSPDGYPEYMKHRSVNRAEREAIFSRAKIASMNGAGAARIVLYDRLTLLKPTYGATWEGHASVAPIVNGNVVRVVVGQSTATITTLTPDNAAAVVKEEPTIKTDDIFMKNDPAEGIKSRRFEIDSPKGSIERRFLTAIVVGASGDKAPQATRIDGEGAAGAAIESEAYVFVTSSPQKIPAAISYKAPATATHHIVTGLVPNLKYAINVSASAAPGFCDVAVLPGGDRGVSDAGVIAIDVNACAIAK